VCAGPVEDAGGAARAGGIDRQQKVARQTKIGTGGHARRRQTASTCSTSGMK
jgi:hypothetical protein